MLSGYSPKAIDTDDGHGCGLDDPGLHGEIGLHASQAAYLFHQDGVVAQGFTDPQDGGARLYHHFVIPPYRRPERVLPINSFLLSAAELMACFAQAGGAVRLFEAIGMTRPRAAAARASAG